MSLSPKKKTTSLTKISYLILQNTEFLDHYCPRAAATNISPDLNVLKRSKSDNNTDTLTKAVAVMLSID